MIHKTDILCTKLTGIGGNSDTGVARAHVYLIADRWLYKIIYSFAAVE
jgi:hypothetical protein